MLATRINGGRALCPDWKFQLIGVLHDNLHRILTLRDVRRWLQKFGNFVTRQILPRPIGVPDAVNLASKNLAGIEIESNLDGLTRLHVFQVLLEECR